HAQAGENPELCTLLFRLSHLLECALIPVFVFDGQLRPSMKHGKKVSMKARWLEHHFKEIITAFGFYQHVAPGEAEAELAQMNQAGLIDAIITEDSDVLVFGAKLILHRYAGILADPDLYTLYSADDICSSENIQLTQGGLFLFAILLGGDYANGLQGCGQKTAHALCKTGLGDELLTAMTIMGPTALDNFLVGWRTRLQSELINPTIARVSRHPALAKKLPDDFLNPQILRLYALPVTSWSGKHAPPNAELWKPPSPDIAHIAAFCDNFFHWESDVLLKHLHKNIWPGIIIHSLYRVCSISLRELSRSETV
ncbi:PIN domain-like protein, partial [Desarmillaria tabescens]